MATLAGIVVALVVSAQSGGDGDLAKDARAVERTDTDVTAGLQCPSDLVETTVVDHFGEPAAEDLGVLVRGLREELADWPGVVDAAEEVVTEGERHVHMLDEAGRRVGTYVVVDVGAGWAVALVHTCAEAH